MKDDTSRNDTNLTRPHRETTQLCRNVQGTRLGNDQKVTVCVVKMCLLHTCRAGIHIDGNVRGTHHELHTGNKIRLGRRRFVRLQGLPSQRVGVRTTRVWVALPKKWCVVGGLPLSTGIVVVVGSVVSGQLTAHAWLDAIQPRAPVFGTGGRECRP